MLVFSFHWRANCKLFLLNLNSSIKTKMLGCHILFEYTFNWFPSLIPCLLKIKYLDVHNHNYIYIKYKKPRKPLINFEYFSVLGQSVVRCCTRPQVRDRWQVTGEFAACVTRDNAATCRWKARTAHLCARGAHLPSAVRSLKFPNRLVVVVLLLQSG